MPQIRQTLDELMLYSHREENKFCFNGELRFSTASCFNSEFQFPMANGYCPVAKAGRWSTCHRLVLEVKDPVLSPSRTDIAVDLARCSMLETFKQKQVLIKPETGKDILKKGKMLRTGCESSLFPGKKMFQDRGSFVRNHARIGSLQITAFSNTTEVKFFFFFPLDSIAYQNLYFSVLQLTTFQFTNGWR